MTYKTFHIVVSLWWESTDDRCHQQIPRAKKKTFGALMMYPWCYLPVLRNKTDILAAGFPGQFWLIHIGQLSQYLLSAWRRHQIETFSALSFSGHRWIPLTKAVDAKLWCFLLSAPEEMPSIALLWRQGNVEIRHLRVVPYWIIYVFATR